MLRLREGKSLVQLGSGGPELKLVFLTLTDGARVPEEQGVPCLSQSHE